MHQVNQIYTRIELDTTIGFLSFKKILPRRLLSFEKTLFERTLIERTLFERTLFKRTLFEEIQPRIFFRVDSKILSRRLF